MSGKQMEGDNQRRRALARQARERGQRPSDAGVTLGSSKQPEPLDSARRDGPPAAGAHKPVTAQRGTAPTPAPTPAPAERPRPLPDERTGGSAGLAATGYRDLVAEIGRRTGIDFAQARVAAEATVVALARALDEANRERLLDAVPLELHDDLSVTTADTPGDLAGFLNEVARLSHRPPEQARYQAQATLSALAEQDRALVESLDLPWDLRELLDAPQPGGGLVGSTGGTAPLTEEELQTALTGLPYWSGTRHALSRIIELPPEGLGRVLDQIARLRSETGRGPSIGRRLDGTAVIVVRTGRSNEVTRLDVELAHRVDVVIDEAEAGMAGP